MVNIVSHRGLYDESDTESEESELNDIIHDVNSEISHSSFGGSRVNSCRSMTILSKRMSKSFGAMTKFMKTGKNTTKELKKFMSKMGTEKATCYSLKQLKNCTQNFSSIIGMGSFGTIYKGVMPSDVEVAVKLLRKTFKEEQFMAEVSILARTYHRNLVRLYGYCIEGDVVALVYDYMENGSLDTILFHSHQRPDWEILYHIAIEMAKGISYLHEECQEVMIHFDIKPDNILLDSNFTAKLADFGLAVLYDRDKAEGISVEIRGTHRYLAPELYRSACVTCKCDVYSFGLVLFDILGRRKREELPESMDPLWFPKQVWHEFEKANLETFLAVNGIEDRYRDQASRLSMAALWCIQYRPGDRPSMSTVVNILKGELEALKPPNPFEVFLDEYSYASTSSTSNSTRTEEIIKPNHQAFSLICCYKWPDYHNYHVVN